MEVAEVTESEVTLYFHMWIGNVHEHMWIVNVHEMPAFSSNFMENCLFTG